MPSGYVHDSVKSESAYGALVAASVGRGGTVAFGVAGVLVAAGVTGVLVAAAGTLVAAGALPRHINFSL